MEKKVKTWLLGVLAAAVLLVALGPILVTRVARHYWGKKPMIESDLRIKAHGTISFVDGNMILTTPLNKNNYLLTGKGKEEIKVLAASGKEVYVFGMLMSPPDTLKDVKLAAKIDVLKFDTKDFSEKIIAPQVMAQKLNDKIAFRKQVLSKVGMNESYMDVITGKLKIIDGFKDGKGRPFPCLAVQDKDGEIYILSNRAEAIKAPPESFLRFKGMDMDVVVVGRFGLPDPGILVPNYPNSMTFLVRGLYNPDLSAFVVE